MYRFKASPFVLTVALISKFWLIFAEFFVQTKSQINQNKWETWTVYLSCACIAHAPCIAMVKVDIISIF